MGTLVGMPRVLSRREALEYEGPPEDEAAIEAALAEGYDTTTAELLSVLDVAAALLDSLGPMDTMRLQKLCYYVQAIHLARTQQPVFLDDIQAWRDGPVAPVLFAAHRGRFRVAEISGGKAERARQHPTATSAINEAVRRYGDLSGRALGELTHREGPWLDSRGNVPPRDQGRTSITVDSIRRYYTDVLADPEWVAVEYDDRPSW